MCQSNQARIRRKMPSLLLGCGQAPRLTPSRHCNRNSHHNISYIGDARFSEPPPDPMDTALITAVSQQVASFWVRLEDLDS
jgi:hypothetical protein